MTSKDERDEVWAAYNRVHDRLDRLVAAGVSEAVVARALEAEHAARLAVENVIHDQAYWENVSETSAYG